MTFSFNPWAMVATHTPAKDQGQRSVGLKDRVKTDGRTDGRMEAIALPPVLTTSVTSNSAEARDKFVALEMRYCDERKV